VTRARSKSSRRAGAIESRRSPRARTAPPGVDALDDAQSAVRAGHALAGVRHLELCGTLEIKRDCQT